VTATKPDLPTSARSPLDTAIVVRKTWPVLLIACGASFTELLDASIVNVALYTIRNDLGLSNIGLQWVVNAYLLMFGGFLLLAGRAADLYGRKQMLLVGLVVFVVASLLGGFALNGTWLVLARAAQGIGAAIIAPTTLAILTTFFTDPKQRAGAIGAWITAGVVGAALGSFIGGLLTDLLDWRWVLWINVPVGLALLISAITSLPPSRGQTQRGSFDIAGALAVTAGLVLIVFGTVSVGENGWSSAKTLVTFIGGIVLLGLFLLIESRAAAPIMPLDILRLRTVSSGNAVAFLASAASLPMFYLLGLFLQEVLGLSPLQAGLAFLPVSLGIIAGSFAGSMLVPKFGPRIPMVAGAALAAASQVWLSFTTAGGSYAADVLPQSVLLGIGIGMVFVPSTTTATAGVHEDRAGLASGLVNTSNQFGGALGVAALATLATVFATPTIGYTRAMLVAAGIAALAGAAAMFAPRTLPQSETPA
jgi:EmrB/QacA subfamily drug resistance transporter